MIKKQNNEIEKTLKVLEAGKTILYPTDTVWGIGCDATNEKAIQSIYELKQREESKTMIVLVSNIEMLKKHVQVPNTALDHIENTDRPLTIIYQNPVGVANNLIASDHTLAIRVVNHEFCEKLITKFGKPIVSTSANISGEITPKSYSEISDEILLGVDYVVNLQSEKEKSNPNPSKIIKIDPKGLVTVIRA